MIAIISVYMTPAGDSYDEAVATFDDAELELAEKIKRRLEAKEGKMVRYEIQPYKHTPPPPHNPQSLEKIGEYWATEAERFMEDV